MLLVWCLYKVGNELLSKSKGVLTGEEFATDLQGQQTKQTNKHLAKLYFRKLLRWVRHKGQVLAQPLQIAKALCELWTNVTLPKGGTQVGYLKYLKRLGLPTNFEVMAQGLFRPLSTTLVHEVFM